MDEQQLLDTYRREVKRRLKPARYAHTLRVAETSVRLAERYGAVRFKAEAAAILHDYAKFRPLAEMERAIRDVPEIPLDLLDYHHELWHAFVGAYLIRHELNVRDEDVLGAVRYHTTGRPEMKLLEKIVFLADYIEPGRSFAGVEEVRRLAEHDLDRALCQSFVNTIEFLERQGADVYPLTRTAYAYLCQQKDQ